MVWSERFGELTEWARANEKLLGGLAAISFLMFIGSLLATPWLVSRIPTGYFVGEHGRWSGGWMGPIVRVLKNIFGAILIAAGFAMLFLPGQGILTVFIGIMLLDFPGKRTLEIWILKRPRVVRSVNWMRSKFDQPPLELPDGVDPDTRDEKIADKTGSE